MRPEGTARAPGRSPEDAMDLLAVRHGIAEEREAFARSGMADDARPLTAVQIDFSKFL